MDPQTKIVLLCLTLMGLALVVGVLRVVGAWYDHHISRHDLVVQTKLQRYNYLKAIADREREAMAMEEEAASDSIILEDEAPELAKAA